MFYLLFISDYKLFKFNLSTDWRDWRKAFMVLIDITWVMQSLYSLLTFCFRIFQTMKKCKSILKNSHIPLQKYFCRKKNMCHTKTVNIFIVKCNFLFTKMNFLKVTMVTIFNLLSTQLVLNGNIFFL